MFAHGDRDLVVDATEATLKPALLVSQLLESPPKQTAFERCNGDDKIGRRRIGRTYEGTCVILLVHDLQIRVVNAITGELLRDLIVNPNRDYQPTGAPKGPTRNDEQPDPTAGPAVADLLRDRTVGLTVCWFKTSRTDVSSHPGLMSRVIPD